MTKFCVIGRPNVGKSSLVNAILNQERVIVSNIEGTTRDAIDTPFKREGKEYVVIDTAGIRKRGKVYENIEKYSVLRIHDDLIQYIGLNSQYGIIMNLVNDRQNRVNPLLFQCRYKQDRCIG